MIEGQKFPLWETATGGNQNSPGQPIPDGEPLDNVDDNNHDGGQPPVEGTRGGSDEAGGSRRTQGEDQGKSGLGGQ